MIEILKIGHRSMKLLNLLNNIKINKLMNLLLFKMKYMATIIQFNSIIEKTIIYQIAVQIINQIALALIKNKNNFKVKK